MMSPVEFEEKEFAAESLIRDSKATVDELLKEQGADANFVLYELGKRNCIVKMEELVDKWGADVNATVVARSGHGCEPHKAPPLFAAVESSAVTAVEWLLARGAEADGTCFINGSCITSLWTAAENGNARIGKILLDHGADVNAAKTPNGNTPLYVAAQNGHHAMVSLLLNFGADVNKCLQPRQICTLTPVEIAVGCGNPFLVAQLISGGAEVTVEAVMMLNKIQQSKKSVDQFQRSISAEELEQVKDLLTAKPFLKGNRSYAKAQAAEKKYKYKEALQLLRSLYAEHPCTQLKFDIDRVIVAIYGVAGSDCTISVWGNVPLMTQTEPTHYQDYAWAQIGRKIYRHGGTDKGMKICQREELWCLDIDTRVWQKLKPAGNTPGARAGHTMFAWKGSLYVWGGGNDEGYICDAKLHRLDLTKSGQVAWEVVKTFGMKPPTRAEHAGCVYKGKYYITGGRLGDTSRPTNDAWVLDLASFKWKSLKNGPNDRYHHNMWACNDKLYVLGGRMMHKEDSGMMPHHMSYSIECFVSYDLAAREWKNEPVYGDRPYDISEFTVLPLYDDPGKDDDPTSVVIWGGYSELDRVNGPDVKDQCKFTAFMKARYGDEWNDFVCQYRRRLLRFYPETHVFKKLNVVRNTAPKAQSFAAELKKTSDGSTHLLIGGGYGFTRESMMEEKEVRFGEDFMTPRATNKLFHVVTGDIGTRYAAVENIEGKSWAYDFCKLTADECLVDFSPCSPTLHTLIDYTHEDFAAAPCTDVLPNDEERLLGVRVQLHGLVNRSDLNGKIGRCGFFCAKTQRYHIFIPGYEGGPCSLSVKPINLSPAEPLHFREVADGIRELLAHNTDPNSPNRFPGLATVFKFDQDPRALKQSYLDQMASRPDPKLDKNETFDMMDTYLGPLSREAQVTMRDIVMPGAPPRVQSTGILPFLLIHDCSKLLPAKRAGMARRRDVYLQLAQRLKTRDYPRVKELEKRLMSISDSKLSTTCGKWLRLSVEIDGLNPPIKRELVVSPDITINNLHSNVLSPVFGWTPIHAYSMRRIGMKFSALEGCISQKEEDHRYAMNMMDEECWIGPKKSKSFDTVFLPLYIGGYLANDKDITLGQLFCDMDGNKEMYLQYVHDLGSWISHTLTVSKLGRDDAVQIPSDATVAHLIAGSGGVMPEDIGGLQGYIQALRQLSGRSQTEHKSHEGIYSHTNPSSELWWSLFNDHYRFKSNGFNFFRMPGFNLQRSRELLEIEIRRPKQKSGQEFMYMSTFGAPGSLPFDETTQSTVATPKKATDACAYCGVTVALKLCSACGTVAYCCKEHSVLNWPQHKQACKEARKVKKNKGSNSK